MKRTAVMLLTVMLLITCVVNVTAFASSDTYSIPELKMKIDVPSEYYVLLRSTPKDDVIFTTFNLPYDSTMEMLKNSNIYFNALNANLSEEIVITMVDSSIGNFSNFSDEKIKALMEDASSAFVGYGVELQKSEIYNHSQVKFVKMHFYHATTSTYGVQYSTITDYMAINITLRSVNKEITAAQENKLDTMVSSIRFDIKASPNTGNAAPETTAPTVPETTAPPVPETTAPAAPEATAPFENGDADIDIQLGTLPTWEVPEFTIDPEFIKPTYDSFDFDIDFESYEERVEREKQEREAAAKASERITISLIGIVLWALIPGFVARKKGRSFWGYYFLSFLISPLITMIITFCLSDLNKARQYRRQHEISSTPTVATSWECTNCGTENSVNYSQCKKCGKTKTG